MPAPPPSIRRALFAATALAGLAALPTQAADGTLGGGRARVDLDGDWGLRAAGREPEGRRAVRTVYPLPWQPRPEERRARPRG